MFTCVYLIFFVLGTVFGGDENQAKLRFYHSSFDDYTEWPLDESTEIFSTSWCDPDKTTVIFCHGFTGHPNGPAVTAIIKAYLEQGQSNVALLNWDRLAAPIHNTIASSYLNWAVPNAIRLGVDFADALMSLSDAGLDLNKTHLVGHSLGAHVMGIAGNNLARNGVTLRWITGLDPAGIGMESKRPHDRLNPNSAEYVEAIHSDPNRYGTKRSMGTVDFWPNFRNVGNVLQPGCDAQEDRGDDNKTLRELCNHNRSWEILLDTLKNPGTVLGSYAKNYRTWKNYSPDQRKANVLEFGKFEPNAVPGNYYFLTAGASPFGLGEDGL
ncbi:lipase member H-like isoform X2 [Anticarsia gemmatalis]|uniref:lipase member H-like isoform X2 n=1 Tax=Anticarsia gemmatalis TaxID=129554 RepID=UPI003F75E3C7